MMASTNPKFRNGEFDGFQSSPEILEACEDVAGYEFNLDDLENCPANRVWQDPTAAEIVAVEAAAWAYAPPDKTELHWGQTTISRTAAQKQGE